MSGLFMQKSEVVAFIPGAYLVATRYPGWKPMTGFVWLEILPFTSLLYCSIGMAALCFPALHWLFLSCYELGYVANDKSPTSAEREERPSILIEGRKLYLAVVIRSVCFGVGVYLISLWTADQTVIQFVAAVVLIVGVLFLHTYIGSRSSRTSALRIFSFATLALMKYVPAALVLAPVLTVMQGAAWVFLLYGAGRVLDYAQKKLPGRTLEKLDINALWYLVALVPAVCLICSGSVVDGALASLCVFGLYYLLVYLKRGVRWLSINA